MPNKIQDIIDKFNSITIGGGGMTTLEARNFLQSSLTSLLNSIEKEALDKIPVDMKRSRKEVINIINSHR